MGSNLISRWPCDDDVMFVCSVCGTGVHVEFGWNLLQSSCADHCLPRCSSLLEVCFVNPLKPRSLPSLLLSSLFPLTPYVLYNIVINNTFTFRSPSSVKVTQNVMHSHNNCQFKVNSLSLCCRLHVAGYMSPHNCLLLSSLHLTKLSLLLPSYPYSSPSSPLTTCVALFLLSFLFLRLSLYLPSSPVSPGQVSNSVSPPVMPQ